MKSKKRIQHLKYNGGEYGGKYDVTGKYKYRYKLKRTCRDKIDIEGALTDEQDEKT